jgi:hypothetical protein
MAILHVKINPQAAAGEKEDLLEATARRKGVKSVSPLFPGHKNSKLANLYSIETTGKKTSDLLNALRERQNVVEFAEEAAPRKLL